MIGYTELLTGLAAGIVLGLLAGFFLWYGPRK